MSHRPRRRDPRLPDTATIRAASVRIGCDPRSVEREILSPGSVSGIAGQRIRAALVELRIGVPVGLSFTGGSAR